MRKKFKYQNSFINYSVSGVGKPVILIHGFGETAEVWRNQVTYLQNFFTLIIPELPGSGSDIIDDMSIEGMAEVIHSIIHEENIESCPVIGHSMGGYITLALAESYWNHVSAIGLVHSSAFADSAEKKATRKKGIEFIRQHSAQEFLKTMIPTLFAPLTKDKMPELIDQQLEAIHNFSGGALVSYYEAMINRPDRTHVLSKHIGPVLFTMGKSDKAVPVEDVLKQTHIPEISYIHLLENSGHMGMLEEPDKTNTLLKQFLLNI